MKLVVSSDWHVDWMTDGFSRRGDVSDAVHSVVMHCIGLKQQGEDVVFMFAGDLTNPFSRGMHRAVAFAVEIAATLNEEGIPNVWLVGNHDIVEDGGLTHMLMALKAARFPTTTVVEEGGHQFHIYGKTFIGLPFTPSSHTYDPAAVVMAGYDPADVVFGHLSIEGILRVGSETTDMPRGRDILFPIDAVKEHHPNALMINGHYHRQQVFKGICIPGSLAQLTHGEEENTPSFLVFDL